MKLDDLSNTFQDQKWSSQSSGIEIKGHVEELRKMWKEIVSKEAKKMTDKKEFAVNTILYGPPGTGKTYNAVIYAVAICDAASKGESIRNYIKGLNNLPYDGYYDYDNDILHRYNELKDAGRIKFTTFHQSYGYEEFIEGIRPVMPKDDEAKGDGQNDKSKNDDQSNSNGVKDLLYKIEPGVFKEICIDAAPNCCKGEDNNPEQKGDADLENCSEYRGDNVADNVEITFASNKQDSESDRENSKEITEVITIDEDRPFWVLSVGYDSGLSDSNAFSYKNHIVFTDYEIKEKTAVEGMQKDDLFLLKVKGRQIVRFGQIVGERTSELPKDIEIQKGDLKPNQKGIIAKYYWKVKWLTSDLDNCTTIIEEIFGKMGQRPSWEPSDKCKSKFIELQKLINDNIGNGTVEKPTLEGFKAYLMSNMRKDSVTPDKYCRILENIVKDGYKQLLGEDISFDEFYNKIVNNERLEEVYDLISKKSEGKKGERTIEQYKRVVNYFIKYYESFNFSNNTEASQQPASNDNPQDKQQYDYSASGKLQPYVFIIDEINRGNISKIFGELITLIEDTKRQGEDEAASAILPYSGEPFSVPNNVYILGTMNTADRSIALMDTALRRRFNFEEMMPDPDLLKVKDSSGKETDLVINGINIRLMLETINDRIEYLYDREHTIGHAFFIKLLKKENQTLDVLAEIFRNKIIPLLQEYFYDDYAKISLVLGGNFIISDPKKASDLFKGQDISNIEESKNVYKIDRNAFDKAESYTGIYSTNNSSSNNSTSPSQNNEPNSPTDNTGSNAQNVDNLNDVSDY